MENKTIKGSISFEIKVINNEVTVLYDGGLDNEIGALAIAHKILSDEANHYQHLRDTTTGKDKAAKEKLKMFIAQLNVFKKGRNAVVKVVDALLSNYDNYLLHQKEVEEKKDEKTEEIKKYFEDNNITIENGKLSNEEAMKLLGDKYKDLASSSDENVTSL